jgi:phage terminase large subunit-like protein
LPELATTLSYELHKTARLIPGYDPFATAGDCVFDEERAAFAIAFIQECCHHVKGELAGKPLILQPWEAAIVSNLFGWIRPDGTRRYREVFVFVPRKNGKTCLIAAILIYVLYCDGEPGAEIYSAAADRDQARLVFEQARGMVNREPELTSRAKIYQNSIVVGDSTYKAISAEAGTKHGYNGHLIVIDELHAQPDRELVDVLMTSTGARRQPIVLHITTSDFERESICNEKHDYASKVRDGIIDDSSFLPVIYQASLDDDWKDPKVWAMANPNLGVSVSEEYLRRECQRAIESPTFENTFKRLHLNIRTEQDVRWLSMDRWDACQDSFTEAELADCPCWFALDLSTTTDVTALTKCYRRDGEYWLVPHFWIPESKAHEREKRDRVPYLTWAHQGLVTLTPGDAVDYGFVRRDINTLAGQCLLQELVADPWNASHLLQEMKDQDGLPVVEHRQGYVSMNTPMKEFEKAVIARHVHHDGNPVLRWMVSNVVADMDPAGNIKPNKAKSGGSGRIDGAVTSIMAVGRAALGEGHVFDADSVVVV